MSCGIKRQSQAQQSVPNVYSSPSNSFSRPTMTQHSTSNSYSSSASLHTVSSPILKSPVPPVHDFSSTRPSCGTRNPPSITQAPVVRPQPSIARPASRCAPKPSYLPAASAHSSLYASGSSFSSGAQSFQAAPAPKPTCGAKTNSSDPSCLFNGGNLCELGFPAAPGWCTFEVKNGCQ